MPIATHKHLLTAAVACVVGTATSHAATIVDFTTVGGTGTINLSNSTTLTIDVDALGNAALDYTSAASPFLADEVDNATAGTLAATGSPYTITITMTGTANDGTAGGPRGTNGLGVGIQGNGADVITFTGAVSQALNFEVDLSGLDPSLVFTLTSVDTNSSANTPAPQLLDFTASAIALTADTDSAVAGAGVSLAGGTVGSFTINSATAGNKAEIGFALGGFTFDVTPIPEPGSLALLTAGVGLIALRRRGA
ncbi:MAG: PEP-CTERM sorting domain-containing protein [Planctomycetota bacterium]